MNHPAEPNRRQFVTASAAAVAALGVAPAISTGAWAGGSDLLKLGLIGCGGRGTGAASQALQADSGVELFSMADAFDDRLQSARDRLKRQFNKDDQPARVTVTDDQCHVGFDGYRRVIDACDVVCLTTTPHFRPAQLRYAVEAGKHVFCEKPVAVDAPGVRSVLESSKMAAEKKISLVSGLCWRYHNGKRAVFDQIKEGTIGDIVSMECNYMTGGVWDPRKTRDECASEMEYQMRNWYYYTWLSGDFNVEQHIHSLDKMMWAMNDEPPVSISGSGGRQVRTAPEYGNIYDHFNVIYEWANGVKAHTRCRHWAGCENDVSDYIVGTKGRVDVMKHIIYDHSGKEIWKFEGDGGDMYQIEHDELFAGIRGANPINNGDYMCKSTMMAIAGRMAGYTGQHLTWEQVMNSQENLTPETYEWGDIPVPEVAIPGKTKFV
ncbi:MAG: Gfo/Idh/MocA family oxidoreductase [Planctomycetaceae bacterium]